MTNKTTNNTCPFCHKNKTKTIIKSDALAHYNGSQWVRKVRAYTKCNCCHARGPIVSKDVLETQGGITREIEKALQIEAAKKWNINNQDKT